MPDHPRSMARGPGENPPVAARQWGGGGEERAASGHTFTACPRGGVRWLRGNPLAAACPISWAAPPCSPGRGAGPNRLVRRLPPVDGGAAPTPRRHLPAPRVGGRGGHHPALAQWPRPAVDGCCRGGVPRLAPLVVWPPLAGQRLGALRQPTACGGRHPRAARRPFVRKERGATVRTQGAESPSPSLRARTHSPNHRQRW